ncbi:hypothetical protein M3Y97_01115900 [Aphelenchoides bicaudatus]|nr:hypothetical protein M3Y97_01115900 [Aphelenchoides bicaudatus]
MYFLPTLLFVLAIGVSGREQFAAVKGKLMCGAKPAENVVIRLYDRDVDPDPDDLLDFALTDITGEFDLKGSTSEAVDIEPVLRIYTDCNDSRIKMALGLRKISFILPYQYVTNPGVTTKYFDIGTINLESRFPGEEREQLSDKHRRHHYRYNRLTYDNDFDMFDGL